jgi:hypothetical protein
VKDVGHVQDPGLALQRHRRAVHGVRHEFMRSSKA